MRKKIFILSVLIIAFAVTIVPTFSQQEDANDVIVGNINYSKGWVYAEGEASISRNQGKDRAIVAVEAIAERNLAKTIKGMWVDSKTNVGDVILTNDEINRYVERVFIQNAQRVGSIRYLTMDIIDSDGRKKVEMDKDIIVMKVGKPYSELAGKILSEIMPQSREKPPAMEKSPSPQTQESPIYSGLIIDARGFSVRPALAPKILDEDGTEVYGSAYVDRNWAITEGMAGYTKSIDDAKANDRVNKEVRNPMIINGKMAKDNNVDIVISNEDANKIRKTSSYQKFLDECRVMIVLQKIVS